MYQRKLAEGGELLVLVARCLALWIVRRAILFAGNAVVSRDVVVRPSQPDGAAESPFCGPVGCRLGPETNKHVQARAVRDGTRLALQTTLLASIFAGRTAVLRDGVV